MVVDSRTPTSVKMAAVLVSVSVVLHFAMQVSGVETQRVGSFAAQWWPWPQMLGLVVVLIVAWDLTRLDGAAYWFTVVGGSLWLAGLLTLCILAWLGVSEQWPMAEAGLGRWCEVLLLVCSYVLLIVKSSRRAPWAAPWNRPSSR